MADFDSKYSGEQVEQLLDQVASGNAGGGGGGITEETDPIFSASPAASITEEKIAEWDAKSAQGEKGEKGDKGDTGVGVQSVEQTTTSDADGGSNVVTVTLTNGASSTFTVKNGSKGSQGIQGEQGPKGDTGAAGANGTNGHDGTDGADGATFTPSVDSEGNLSWTNNKGLTNPPTVNIKGPKGDKGDAGEGGGSSGGDSSNSFGSSKREVEYRDMPHETINGMRPDVVYFVVGSADLTINSFEEPPQEQYSYDVFTVILSLGQNIGDSVAITLPSDVQWANGVVPDATMDIMELSISRVSDGYGWDIYNAVLIPFKPV